MASMLSATGEILSHSWEAGLNRETYLTLVMGMFLRRDTLNVQRAQSSERSWNTSYETVAVACFQPFKSNPDSSIKTTLQAALSVPENLFMEIVSDFA